MSTFATQNNWILPTWEDNFELHMKRMDNEVFGSLGFKAPWDLNDPRQWVREMALNSQFECEPAPIWESMRTFYFDRFYEMKYALLKQIACNLGLSTKRSHAEMVGVLTNYFNEKVGI